MMIDENRLIVIERTLESMRKQLNYFNDRFKALENDKYELVSMSTWEHPATIFIPLKKGFMPLVLPSKVVKNER